MLAAFIFVVDKKTDLISAPHALVYFAVVIFFVYFKAIKSSKDDDDDPAYHLNQGGKKLPIY